MWPVFQRAWVTIPGSVPFLSMPRVALAEAGGSTEAISWGVDGIPVCTATDTQENPAMVSTGDGGAIIAWQDWRSASHSDIYAQRVLPNGSPSWQANGVSLCSDPAQQYFPQIATDGRGGAIVIWEDTRYGGPELIKDLFANRVTGAGVAQWGSSGDTVCVAPGDHVGFPHA
jgi:hypothetical protein